jgi:hypothetical protein
VRRKWFLPMSSLWVKRLGGIIFGEVRKKLAMIGTHDESLPLAVSKPYLSDSPWCCTRSCDDRRRSSARSGCRELHRLPGYPASNGQLSPMWSNTRVPRHGPVLLGSQSEDGQVSLLLNRSDSARRVDASCPVSAHSPERKASRTVVVLDDEMDAPVYAPLERQGH